MVFILLQTAGIPGTLDRQEEGVAICSSPELPLPPRAQFPVPGRSHPSVCRAAWLAWLQGVGTAASMVLAQEPGREASMALGGTRALGLARGWREERGHRCAAGGPVWPALVGFPRGSLSRGSVREKLQLDVVRLLLC